MSTILYSHPACIEHRPGTQHPERPERLKAILAALEEDEFQGLDRREAPRASIDQIALVHDRDYVHALLDSIPSEGHVALAADTRVPPGSGEAALRAAGAACAAGAPVIAGEARTAFCAVRPAARRSRRAVTLGLRPFHNDPHTPQRE